MTLERHVGDAAQRLNDQGADGDRWNEVAVHHVDVEQVGFGKDLSNVVAEPREVGRQDRWCELVSHASKYIRPQPASGGSEVPYRSASFAGRPRANSAPLMRLEPSGWTSIRCTAPRPAWTVCVLPAGAPGSPGGASTAWARHTFNRAPRHVVHAP